jgi:hypothetical protein
MTNNDDNVQDLSFIVLGIHRVVGNETLGWEYCKVDILAGFWNVKTEQ